MAKQTKEAEKTIPAPTPAQTPEQPKQDAPAPEQPKAPPTLDELKKARLDAMTAYNDALAADKPQEEIDKLSRAAFVANKAVTDFINTEKAQAAQKELDAKLNEHIAIVDDFEKVVEHLPNKAERDANEGYKTIRNKLVEELKKSFGKTKIIHVAPQGMSGKQLERSVNGGSATGELIELMKQGKTNEEIENMFPDRYPRTDKGLVHGTIRTARWKFNQSK